MDGKKEQIKGRIKEAAGVLTDNDRLKREGKLDQSVGKVKEKAEKTMDKIKDALTEQKSLEQGGMMRMGRQDERRGDRTAQSVKLVLLPCLCDLNELATGRRNAHAR